MFDSPEYTQAMAAVAARLGVTTGACADPRLLVVTHIIQKFHARGEHRRAYYCASCKHAGCNGVHIGKAKQSCGRVPCKRRI